MSKNNMAALSEKHKAPEHHRVKPQQFYHAVDSLAGHCYCANCGAISFKRRWYIDAAQEQILRQDKNATAVLCPGCTRVEQEQYEGEVVIANSKFTPLMGEIIALIKHTECRCWHHNPLAKIANVTEKDEIIHIQTTTRFLAERIGKELHKTFKGNLEIKRTAGEGVFAGSCVLSF